MSNHCRNGRVRVAQARQHDHAIVIWWFDEIHERCWCIIAVPVG